MKRRVRSSAVLLAALCAVAGLALVPRPTRADNASEHRETKDTEAAIKVTLVSQAGSSVKAGRAEGIVDAPLEAIKTVVEDYAGYEKFMPHFRASRVLSRRGSSALVYMQASLAKDTMTLWAQLKVTPKPGPGKMHVIEAKMVQGNMDAMFARWELTPVDAEHTLVAFQVLMDPKVPLPASLVSNENEKASQKTIRALRRVVAERTARAGLTANDGAIGKR